MLKPLRNFSALALLLLFTGLLAVSTGEGKSISSIGSTVLPLQSSENGPESGTDWPMAGANPQRTSRNSAEIRGGLDPLWFRIFEPYISQKVQIVASGGTLYVATSRGLYALDAATGADKWVYPTEHPLGHSPTVADGTVYVGGLDNRLHAIDATTGLPLWTYTAGAGFETNPLVVEGKVYAGNRDGYFYAIHATGPNAGELAWRYETDGPILFSAAYQDGVIFFASNDSHAYALNAATGAQIWKSAKLPGAGFFSWWPVVWRDRVIFTGSNNYRVSTLPGPGSKLTKLELEELYPNYNVPPYYEPIGAVGNAPGDWAPGSVTIDVQDIVQYLQAKPWRRTIFVLDRFTGEERELAPLLWTGTHSGNRYPPVVGPDEVLYQQSNYLSSPTIAGGQIAGWQPGVPYISIVSSDWGAVDEPHSAAMGGSVLYWNLCCDRQSGSFDVAIPNQVFQDRYNQGIRPPTGAFDSSREWQQFIYDLDDLIPGYDALIQNPADHGDVYASFGVPNGVYGYHADTNAPVPYNGRLYLHRGNALIAFADHNGSPVQLPSVPVVPVGTAGPQPDATALKAELADQVQRMLDAGHLRPGYMSHGIFDLRGQSDCGDDLVDYFHQPAETLYTLTLALPHLSTQMRQQVLAYMQAEYAAYPPHAVNHVGWQDGAARETFILPPEAEASLPSLPPRAKNLNFEGWNVNPFTFYALWKYAAVTGNAQAILSASASFLEAPPPDETLLRMPFVHNAYIAGYMGYLGLEAQAGQPETPAIRAELNRLLSLRASTFTRYSAYASQRSYCRTLAASSNFMYLTPELATYLRTHVLPEVQAALQEYERNAPYWFVSFATEGFAENAINPLYDAQAIFAAKALILYTPARELREYLDVPAFAVGDLYYIQKLVYTLEQVDVQSHYLPLVAAQD